MWGGRRGGKRYCILHLFVTFNLKFEKTNAYFGFAGLKFLWNPLRFDTHLKKQRGNLWNVRPWSHDAGEGAAGSAGSSGQDQSRIIWAWAARWMGPGHSGGAFVRGSIGKRGEGYWVRVVPLDVRERGGEFGGKKTFCKKIGKIHCPPPLLLEEGSQLAQSLTPLF